MRIGDWNSDVCSSDLHESLVLDITGIYRRRLPVSGAARSQRQRAYRGPALANRAFAGPGSAAGLSLLRDPVHCAACAGLDKRRPGAFPSLAQPTFAKTRTWTAGKWLDHRPCGRSEEHTSELQSLFRISFAVFSSKTTKKKQ